MNWGRPRRPVRENSAKSARPSHVWSSIALDFITLAYGKFELRNTASPIPMRGDEKVNNDGLVSGDILHSAGGRGRKKLDGKNATKFPAREPAPAGGLSA